MTGYPAEPAAALFLAPAEDRSADLATMLAQAAPDGGLLCGHRIGGALPKPNPDTGGMLSLLPCPFGAIVLAQGPAAQTMSALRGLVEQGSDAIDLAASALLVGTQHDVKPGEGAVLVTMLVRRRPELAAPAFRRRWLGEHARFGMRIPVSGYRQLHADPRAVPGLPATDRFDGAGMVLFRDTAHVAAARATPAISRDATRDEMKFVDHAGSMLAMFRLVA